MEKRQYIIYNPRLNTYQIVMAVDFRQAFLSTGWTKEDNCTIVPPNWPIPLQLQLHLAETPAGQA